ncbi:MAG: DUF6895 family protein [Candidatus Rokuibacteriota bacterium]
MGGGGVIVADGVTRAAALASAWLAGLVERTDGTGPPPLASMLHALAGRWICERGLAAGARHGGLRALAREAARRLDSGRSMVALERCDVGLALLCGGILRALGCPSATLEAFVAELARAVPERGAGAEMFAVRFLLNRLGLHPPPGRHRLRAGQLLPAANPFRGDASSMRAVAAQVAAATAYGRTACSRDAELRARLAEVVPVWMLARLREYDLELGALLLRTMGYLKLRRDLVFREGLRFLLVQQQPDGRFGFVARDLGGQASARRRDAIHALHLPTTVCCLWAIAEASNPQFVLLRLPP